MTRLRRGLIILIVGLFLAVVSIGGAQAATTVRGSKSNSNDKVIKDKDPKDKETKRVEGDQPFKGPKSTKPDKLMKPSKGTIYNPDSKLRHSKDPKAIKGDPPSLPGSGDPLKGLNVTKSKNLRKRAETKETKGDNNKVYTPKSLKNLGK